MDKDKNVTSSSKVDMDLSDLQKNKVVRENVDKNIDGYIVKCKEMEFVSKTGNSITTTTSDVLMDPKRPKVYGGHVGKLW